MKNIFSLKREEIQSYLKTNFKDYKNYHPPEIFKWIYRKKTFDFDLMTNLSKNLRGFLKEKLSFNRNFLDIVQEDEVDGTIKFRLRLRDNYFIETVIIFSEKRTTLCVSSQVGCAMGCTFCLTSKMGFKRNLRLDEIIDQLIFAEEIILSNKKIQAARDQHLISNIVFMGMGEPLNNLEEVGRAIDIMKDQMAFGYSKRRITVSTCGVADRILDLPKFGDPNLAISLNAVNDNSRTLLMPVNKRFNIDRLFNVLKAYPLERGRRITFEYILFKDINDSTGDADILVKLLRKVPSKINLICFNEFKGAEYKSPSRDKALEFTRYLLQKGAQANLRESKGKKILAACGLLAGK